MATDARLDAFLTDGCEVFTSVMQGQALYLPDPYDVASINAPARRAFERLLTRATRTPPPDDGKLLLLLGESGSGKTHLVRAFRNSVHGRGLGYVGYLPMTVDAPNYDRHILSYFIDSLDRPYDLSAGDDSGLMRLSHAVIAKCTSAFAPLIPAERILDDEELHGIIHSVADELHGEPAFRHVDVNLLRALLYLQRHDARFHHRVLQWLRCEDLAPADRKVIGELVPRTAADDPGRMLEHLGRLMGVMGHALVLCVDQMEDISDFEQNPRMEPSFRRAMNSLAALAGRVPTAVVVVCCLTDFWTKMKPMLTRALVDRIENDPDPVELDGLVDAQTARDMAAKRLRFLYAQREATFDEADPTFPIPTQGFEKLGRRRTRDVLEQCRRYRDRAIQDGTLPREFPLSPKGATGDTQRQPRIGDIEQAWTDFRAKFKAKVPEDDAEIAALLAWAIEVGSDELGGPTRFAVKPRDEESLDVAMQPGDTRLFVALCNKSSRGGHLGRQMADALKAAAGQVPVLVRTTEFPGSLGTVVADQTTELMRRGGRRTVLGDSDLRELVALRAFQKEHPEPTYLDWSRAARPVTRLKSVSDVLALEKLGPPPAPPAPRGPGKSTPAATAISSRDAPRAEARSVESPSAARHSNPLNSAATSIPPRAPPRGEARAAGVPSATRLADTLKQVPLPLATGSEPVPTGSASQEQGHSDAAHLLELKAVGTMLSGSGPRRSPTPTETPRPPQPAARQEVLAPGPLPLGTSEGIFTQSVSVTPDELTKHSAFLGGSGSGKTTLALNLVEQLLLQGVPALLLDRKGDLATYARPEAWEEKLEDPALVERRRLLRERVDVALYTPGRSDGRPLAIPLVPRGLEALPAEEREQGVQQATDAIASMLDYKNSQRDKAARALLAQALRLLVERPLGRELSLDLLHRFIASQDAALVHEADGLDLKVFPKLAQDLATLNLNKRALLASGGEKLDVEELLGRGPSAVPGKTRLGIISTKFLGDTQSILFWVSQLLLETNRWASQHPAAKLQAVVLFDEADLYLPAQSQPATKQPMENLLKRARSAGVGVMLATQSPGDLDYKCRENVRTWFVGRVKEDTALKKLRPMFADARVDANVKLPAQKQGQFHVLRDGKVEQLKADRSVMRTEQLAEDEILKLARQTLERGSAPARDRAAR